MTNSILQQLNALSQHPHARLVLQGTCGFVVLQSYAFSHQALCEFATNTYLPKERHLSKEQEALLESKQYTQRRNGRIRGRVVPIQTDIQQQRLLEELTTLFAEVYHESLSDVRVHFYPEVLSGLRNSAFLRKMKELGQKRTHALRIELYKAFLNATFLLAVDDDDHPLVVDELAKLPCFAVFTDDKSIRLFDPRGVLWRQCYGFEAITAVINLNPASLIINPKGDISGEFYKNEIQHLYTAFQRQR